MTMSNKHGSLGKKKITWEVITTLKVAHLFKYHYLMHLSCLGMSLKNSAHSTDWALVFVTIHKQPLPLPHYCGISNLTRIAASLVWEVKWCTHVSSPVNSLNSTVIEYLNVCQDETSAAMCSATVLKNSDISVDYARSINIVTTYDLIFMTPGPYLLDILHTCLLDGEGWNHDMDTSGQRTEEQQKVTHVTNISTQH